MLDDPVTRSALIVIVTVFFALVIAITVMYLLIRSGEKGAPKPPHKAQMWLAGLIGIAVPLLVLAYALVFSPSARLTPQQLHQQEIEKAKEHSEQRR
jgi:ABC-type Fe3+ transport system permease subunit